MSSSYTVEPIPGPKVKLGEGPHWDHNRQCLYYVSLSEATIHRLDYRENKVYSAKIDGCSWASFIIPVKNRNKEFVVGDGTRLVLISWDGITDRAAVVKVIADMQSKERGNRWNDGKVDAQGRLHAGTMTMEQDPFEVNSGSFYRFNASDGIFEKQLKEIYISNGFTWNNQTKKFYFADSGAYNIKEFDFDEQGNLTNGKVWYDFTKAGEKPVPFPDGMTIDQDGNLYVAVYYGAKVVKINPSGKIVQEIKIPARQITSVAFGGPLLDELYVTTANMQTPDKRPDPSAGSTFKVTGLGTKGTLMNEIEL